MKEGIVVNECVQRREGGGGGEGEGERKIDSIFYEGLMVNEGEGRGDGERGKDEERERGGVAFHCSSEAIKVR